jgi:hypothetical protein
LTSIKTQSDFCFMSSTKQKSSALLH